MSERTDPLTPTVLFVGDKRSNWTNPPIYRLTARYATPTTVACDPVPGAKDVTLKPMAGRKVILKQQHHVYPVRDDATWARIEAHDAALQAALDDLAAGLRTLGSYARRLQEAGGVKTAPNPLCATVILAPDPDTDRETWYTSALVPRLERKAIARHTPKMLATQPDAASYVFSQGSTFVCPDDATWEDIQSLRAAAQAQADAWQQLLRSELLVYAFATKDARYARTWPALPDGSFYGHHRQSSEYMHVWRLEPTKRAPARHVALCTVQPMQEAPKPANLARTNLVLCPDCRKVLTSRPNDGPAPAPLAIAEPPAIAGVVMMSADEARACIVRITASLETVRRDLLALHEQEGWKALGYDSWRACVTAEFGQSQSYLYRQLAAAEIERDLGFAIGETPESHLRPLATLPSTEARQQALARADALAGNQPRQAKHVAQAVADAGLRVLANAAAPAVPSDLHAALTAAGWAWDGTWYRQDGRVMGPDSPPDILWSIANPDGSPHPPPPLPVIPALDMDRIAALAVRDIHYISSRTTADGRELHTIRGAFGERETALPGIDHLIATVSPIEALDDAPAESWDARATTALDLLMKFDIDPRYPGRLPGTLDLAIELVAALAIGLGLAESELVGKLTAALASYTEAAHAHAA